MAERKLNLFDVLKRIDNKQVDFYGNLTDDERKEFHPLVIQRWMSGCNDPYQINALNEFVNPYVFDFGKDHKELLAKMLVACSSGQPKRYKYIKANTRTGYKYPTIVDVICRYYQTTHRHAKTYVTLLRDDAILGFADELGVQKDELKKLKKELKDRGKI